MKLVVFEIDPWERELLEGAIANYEIESVPEPLSPDNVERCRDAHAISTFIYSDLSTEVLKTLPQLKLIATRSTGFDHIDTDYCTQQGVTVCNVPTYGENTVAEHAFGLLLALSHKLVEAANRTRRGDFTFKGLQGFDLRGKTLGVIGTGSIGQCVIEIAKGFRMEVVAFDPTPKAELAEQLGFRYAEIEEVLATADIVTLHVPASDKTHHLLSTEQFDQLDGAILINTSRGSVVDIQALLHALAQGKVTAAGLDVLPEELMMRSGQELLQSVDSNQNDSKLLANQVLLSLDNVIVTPHSAFNTREARERILQTTADNLTAFVNGEPQNVVTKEK